MIETGKLIGDLRLCFNLVVRKTSSRARPTTEFDPDDSSRRSDLQVVFPALLQNVKQFWFQKTLLVHLSCC